jgi:hypothetical protein
VETGVLVGERGAYRLAQALARLQVPATVQAVLTARIDRLPPEEKRLLHRCSRSCWQSRRTTSEPDPIQREKLQRAAGWYGRKPALRS